jgi:hypothetical protein
MASQTRSTYLYEGFTASKLKASQNNILYEIVQKTVKEAYTAPSTETRQYSH